MTSILISDWLTGGGSLPNTPLRTPRSFHFPPSTLASGPGLPAPVASGSLDLSLKKVSGSETSEVILASDWLLLTSTNL